MGIRSSQRSAYPLGLSFDGRQIRLMFFSVTLIAEITMHSVLVYGGLYFLFQMLALVLLQFGWADMPSPKALIGGPLGLAAVIGTLVLKKRNRNNEETGNNRNS